MAELIPYLSFPGCCEQALAFYCHCFDGQIQRIQRYADASSTKGLGDESLNISYAEFVAPAVRFIACDRISGEVSKSKEQVSTCGVSLALQFTNLNEQESVFTSLAESATVILPLTKRFWGARYAELIDQWGIHWRLNCQINQR